MKITFKRAPAHMGGDDVRAAYGSEPDPLPTPFGFKPSGWIGYVYPCPGRSVYRPTCVMSAMNEVGNPCGGWHGTTHTVQVSGHPSAHMHSAPDRVTMAERLYRQRQAWAERLPVPVD